MSTYIDWYIAELGREYEGIVRAPITVSEEISMSMIALGYILDQATRATGQPREPKKVDLVVNESSEKSDPDPRPTREPTKVAMGFINMRWGASPWLKSDLLQSG